MTKCVRNFALLMALVVVASLPAWAQATASLTGTVADPTGALIPGAKVTVTHVGTGATRTATTDASGKYLVPQLAPATYKVEVEMSGFKTAVHDQVPVQVGITTTLNIQLEVGAVTETVRVVAMATTLNTSDATVGNNFGETQITQLPFSARNPIAPLTLQPGVVFTGESDLDLLSMGSTNDLEGRDGVVNGIRSNQTNVSLDGADVNDAQSQAAFTSAVAVTLDSVQEFRVITTNANAVDGVAAGAQVELITKSGTNDIHGNVRWFHRNDATAATPFFNNKVGQPTPKNIRNQFGASAGGPFVQDRAFWFADWEQRRDNTEVLQLRDVPSDDLRNGIFTYELDTSDPAFNSGAPGVIPCPTIPGSFCRQFNAADILALDTAIGTDPALTGAPLGINPAMLAFMAQFPSGNSPSEAFDSGLNFNVLRFNAPVEVRNNVYTTRFDFYLDREGKHTVFWRGSLTDIKTQIITPPFFPGLEPRGDFLNNGRGFSTRYTALLSPTVVNTFTWGFTRAGIEQTGQKGDRFSARSFDPNKPFNRAFGRRIPTQNLRNDTSWTRGSHTFQFGTNVRFIENQRFTESNVFAFFVVNDGFCQDFCRDVFRLLNVDADPNNDVASRRAFDRSFMMLTGSITQVNNNFFVDPQTVTFQPSGTPQPRDFAENDFELYFQDTWRIVPSLTLTAGVRYSYFGPVWETNGRQVRPTVDMREWWNQRIRGADQGVPTDVAAPLLAWELAGKENNAPAWYDPDKNNFGPRAALAWSPGFDSGVGKLLFGSGGQGVLRAGAGIFYHRIGQSLAVSTDVEGSPGLGNFLINPVAQFGLSDAPRFTGVCDQAGCTGMPPLSTFLNIPAATFPATPGTFSDGNGFVVDNNLTTPYSINFNLSYQREVKGITFEAGYVGTLGRQLLTKSDYAQMMWNFRDPASGATLEQAFTQIVDLMGPDPLNPVIDIGVDAQVQTITPNPFIENVFSNMCFEYGFLLPGACNNNTQAFFALATLFAPTWSDMIFLLDVSDPIDGFCAMDVSIDPECFGGAGPGVPGRVFFQPQFNSLAGFFNWGSSNYHSFQFSARRTVGNFIFNANYVLSKSIDNGSNAENEDQFNALGGLTGQIPQPLRSKDHRAVSDFDLRHNFNANWVVQLPFGRGRALGTNAGGVANHLIGDWQLSGTWRWRSGFPISPDNGFNFPTNFFLTGDGTLLRPTPTDVTKSDPKGEPNLFADPDAALANVAFTRPGKVGSRNVFRSDDFFNLDLGVGKTVNINETLGIQFRWEVFNLFNNVNFDTDNVDLDPESPSTFGRFLGTAGGFPGEGAREIQFVIRILF